MKFKSQKSAKQFHTSYSIFKMGLKKVRILVNILVSPQPLTILWFNDAKHKKWCPLPC